MRRQFLFTYFLISLLYQNAQTGAFIPGSQKVDSLLNAFMDKWNIAGGSVAFSKDGKLIINSGYGYSDANHLQPAGPGTRYRIASVSKPLTAISIMKLVEAGKLSLSDTVFGPGRWLNDPYYLDVIKDQRLYSVTVEHLLEHTAGWNRNVSSGKFSHSDWPFYPLDVASAEGETNPVGDSTLIRYSLRKGLDNEPGKVFAYSNVGYLILGKLIEKVTGIAYDHFVSQTLFNPVSACDVALARNMAADKLSRESQYMSLHKAPSVYGDGSQVSTPYGGFNIEAMGAHGGWISTASDLVRILLSVDQFDSRSDLLGFEYTSLMTTPGKANPFYAKGWSVNRNNNWWHTGSLEGTASFICRAANGYTWAFLFNGRGDNSPQFWQEFDRLPWKIIAAMHDVSGVDLFAPSVNTSSFRFAQSAGGTFRIKWHNGNGNARLIMATEGDKLDHFPVDGFSYKANTQFGKGACLGGNTFVVYNGSGNELTLTGLEPGKTYTLSGLEYYNNRRTWYQEIYKLGCNETVSITPELELPSMP